jgi:hypothetical protein
VDYEVGQHEPAGTVQVIEVDLDHDHRLKPRQRSGAGIGFRSSGLKDGVKGGGQVAEIAMVWGRA